MAGKKGPIIEANKVERQVWALAEPVARQCGAELIDVEFVREAGSWYLRVFINRTPPVDLDLCERVSQLLSPILDKNDPCAENYFLEVSSPGVERPLRREADFLRYAGREIVVRLYAPLEGSKEFIGALAGVEAGSILLDTDQGRLVFPLDQVAKAHLKADF